MAVEQGNNRSSPERLAVITGTGGLGYEAARKLAAQGFRIILAGRNEDKGRAAVAALQQASPHATIQYERLDLASLSSISAFSTALAGQLAAVDLLICNAGIMSPPQRRTTKDGFEVQMGVNHLGHFALTAGLLPLLRQAPSARVVSVTSLAQHHAKIDLDDLQGDARYNAGRAYCASKFAQASFARELDRRSREGGWGIASLAAHPGFARTKLFEGDHARTGGPKILLSGLLGHLIGQSASDGAAPIVHAATAPDAKGGELYGPKGLFEMRGPPGPCTFAKASDDPERAARLWILSEQLTGVRFPQPSR
ncbi:SDR family oxidoreductase [Sphingobium sufflavum]|uniref:SDR family oxidoreductase n=1 Tax=Sphingobium sufflavum TaxID=1129547 RepID=UPI001F3CCF2D|nr:SDR family oxidoreductase [Sphingobium sufflavum]MCE7798296.1 SDR family oxidoreductase [Sphingobium sufflavum]